MASGFCSLRLSLPLACALLAGCSGMLQADSRQLDNRQANANNRHAAQHLRDMREKAMQVAWVGHPYEELIQKLGAPRMLMNIPAGRPWKATVAVYEGQDLDSDCIDAFAVAHEGKSIVYDYFCR